MKRITADILASDQAATQKIQVRHNGRRHPRMSGGSMRRRVGIVVPTFNAGNYLQEAVDAVLAQTEPVDVVVVDDGSTDPTTMVVLDRLGDSGIKVIRLPENGGQGVAMNAGILALDNPYILAVDADDVMDASYAREAADILDARPEVSIVTTPLQKFGASSELYVPQGASRGVKDLLFYNTIPSVSMFRRPAWEAVGGYGSLTWGMDYDFWVRLLHTLGGECVVLPQARYRYRIHSGQVTENQDWTEKVAAQVEMVRLNPAPWRDHVDLLMERLWLNQAELDYYRSRYGKINYAKNVLLNRARGARIRLRDSARVLQRTQSED